jgi:hypothetical protein
MSSRLALVLSATALLVAVLGSTPLGHAVASQVPHNSVGPLQLKRNAVGPAKVAPNAIRGTHVLDGSLLTADFKAGQIPQGPKGDKGEKGEKGERGPAGLTGRELVFGDSPGGSATTQTASATCPAGKVAVGGGAIVRPVVISTTPPALALTSSAPSSGQRGWSASAQEMSAFTGNWRLQAYAVCARVDD